MIDDHPDLERKYRAPRGFGPLPGPRNIPLSQRDAAGWPDEVTTSLAVTLDADADELTRLLPPGTRLSGPARLTVTATRFENLLWLAGRGYPILTVTFPVEHVGSADGPVEASYLAVLWEGLADPVTTGREELGFPKLFAEIRAPRLEDVSATGSADADATWEGFRFFDLTADDLATAPAADQPAAVLGTLVHRYVPALGALDRADIDELVIHPRSAKNPKRPTVTDRLTGTGHFRFRHAQFADMPVQYPVINTLADLSLAPSGPATFTRTVAPAGNVAGAAMPLFLGRTAEPQTVGVL